MSNALATFLYVLILYSVIQNWLWLTAAAVFIVSLKKSPVILIPLAIFVDGYFGHFYSIPVWSILAVTWFVVVENVRPTVFN